MRHTNLITSSHYCSWNDPIFGWTIQFSIIKINCHWIPIENEQIHTVDFRLNKYWILANSSTEFLRKFLSLSSTLGSIDKTARRACMIQYKSFVWATWTGKFSFPFLVDGVHNSVMKYWRQFSCSHFEWLLLNSFYHRYGTIPNDTQTVCLQQIKFSHVWGFS